MLSSAEFMLPCWKQHVVFCKYLNPAHYKRAVSGSPRVVDVLSSFALPCEDQHGPKPWGAAPIWIEPKNSWHHGPPCLEDVSTLGSSKRCFPSRMPSRKWRLHPWNLTWNLKRSPWKRRFLLETISFRFHVKFRGCNCTIWIPLLEKKSYIFTPGDDCLLVLGFGFVTRQSAPKHLGVQTNY